MIDKIKKELETVVNEIIEVSKIKEGDIFVVGCSSSEVCGSKIGTNSNVDVGKIIFETIYSILNKKNIFLAAQCCEHLNRALVVEKECALKYDFDQVNVVPQPKAGGSFGTSAYNGFENPVLVESINAKAKAGLDIGGTLIGMHIKSVVVPLRVSLNKIGEANIICARSRLKCIGGIRAKYDEDLM
ncbi:MAG: TIGR01440 family protein [Ruminococcaceae bacterium]|nr:TIGR01440 family protein [Oscillospiraceae bacterium]